MPARVLGLDIGGANLKAAHTVRVAVTCPFALWKDPAGLAAELERLIRQMPRADQLAVTMTGELCDCFADRTEGVHSILNAIEEVTGERPVIVWQNNGEFVTSAEARRRPLQTASANWLALATYAGRFAPDGPALLVDIGSTTTDIVPLVDGRPTPRGRTDHERLRERELVYLGIRRTPLFAVLSEAELRDRAVWRLVPELFATMQDVFLVLDMVAEAPEDTNTPDGRPATRRHAHARIARHFGADAGAFSEAEICAVCEAARKAFLRRLRQAVDAVTSRLTSIRPIVISAGSGEFLVDELLQDWRWPAARISLNERLGASLSTAAPAYAVAVLAAEELT
jgi:hypothetical protein